MGRLARVISFLQGSVNGRQVSDVTLDPGGEAFITAEQFTNSGEDAHPLDKDIAVTVFIERIGGEVTVGYIDPNNDAVSDPGEKRIYARDLGGASVVDLHLKNDGSAVLDNGNGFIELQANGTVNINGMLIDSTGKLTVPSSLILNGKELDGHTHGGVETGGSNTGPNN